jgi:hypothetical protein
VSCENVDSKKDEIWIEPVGSFVGSPVTVAKVSGQRLMRRHQERGEEPQQVLATHLGRASAKNQCLSNKARCADSKVLTNNMVMVIGPTPPGTGVM